jgi:solute carrier family 25 folate transporter 32
MDKTFSRLNTYIIAIVFNIGVMSMITTLELLQTTMEYLVFAAWSKLIAAATTYPYQVIRARLQDQHMEYKGTWDCVKQTWRYEGARGFYKGLAPYLLHVTPNICLVLLIYEKFTAS